MPPLRGSRADGDGATAASHTSGPGVPAGEAYGPIISQRRSSTSRWYHFDALGSTDRLTGADGSATDTYIYKAFGPLAASTGSTTNPFRYVGRLGYYDQGSGPLYVRARWLRPATGSWLSVDPVEGEPRYAYVRPYPVLTVDASGMATAGESCQRLEPDRLRRLQQMLAQMSEKIPFATCLGDDLRDCATRTWNTLTVECGGERNDYAEYCLKNAVPFCGCTVPNVPVPTRRGHRRPVGAFELRPWMTGSGP